MRIPFTFIALLTLASVCLIGCSSEDETPCPEGTVFTHHAIDPDSVANIDPLGNLNPPGHVFPSDHGGYYVASPPGAKVTYNVQLFSPGDIRITSMVASEHLNAGLTDFELNFEICNDLWGRLGHITTLDEDLFGDTADYTQWQLEDEYTTGGDTYRRWTTDVNISVAGGELLGTTGGNPGQGGLDFGMYDRRSSPPTPANPARWDGYGYIYARLFVEFYEPGPVLDELWDLVNREDVPGDENPGGYNMQDVPGTSHGAWFFPGEPNNPEDPHLALVQSHTDPSRLVFCVGTSIPAVGSGAFAFVPENDGLLNRDFASVMPNGTVYGFVVEWPDYTFFIQMPDDNTLWIESLDGEHTDPSAWVFTDDKVVFKR